jgi:hypothetical protein
MVELNQSRAPSSAFFLRPACAFLCLLRARAVYPALFQLLFPLNVGVAGKAA